MAIPMDCPQQLLIWSEHIEASPCQRISLLSKFFDPVQFSLSAELISDPKPFVSKSLYRLENSVIQ